jgi:hypothetical protein
MRIQTPARLKNILKRELDANDAFITENADFEGDEKTITWRLDNRRTLVVTFATPLTNLETDDLQDKRARLAALNESFADLFAEAARELPTSRPEPAITLQSELNALAGRTHAALAIVIDAKSPIVWGASETPTNADDLPDDSSIYNAFIQAKDRGISWRDLLARPPTSRHEKKEIKHSSDSPRVLHLVPPVDELAGLSAPEKEILSNLLQRGRLAVSRIRANPVLPQLHRGEHLHEAILDDSVAYIARSFATIYILVLVFPGPFDELGAERAMTRVLPIIERLVVSLPPDNTPETRQGAVVALRPRKR